MSAEPLSLTEYMTVTRFDKAPAAPESFDATAAVRRVLALADELDETAASRQVLALDADAVGASEESGWLRDRADDERAQADQIRCAVKGEQ